MELYYIFATLWGREQYTLYGILFIVFGILLSVTACISVALTYFQLSAEDYRWWWRSIFSAGLVLTSALNPLIVLPLEEEGRILVKLCLSFLLSLTNIFRHIFLGNHASQPLQTWYGAFARDSTRTWRYFCLPMIYFLFCEWVVIQIFFFHSHTQLYIQCMSVAKFLEVTTGAKSNQRVSN